MLMRRTRKTHWFRKDAEFSSVSEEMPGKIEESRIILDVGIIVFEVGNVKEFFYFNLFLCMIIVMSCRVGWLQRQYAIHFLIRTDIIQSDAGSWR
jgi:hypothetical protein